MKKNNVLLSIASLLVISQAQAIEPVYEGAEGIRAKIFETNCLACHSSELTGGDRKGAPTRVNYDTFTEAVAHGMRAVRRGVTSGNMPPASSALPALTDEQKQALTNWQALGYPKSKLPAMYSADTQTLALPKVYFKDGNGDISLKWNAELKLLPSTQPLQFELLKADEIDASTIKEGNHN
jgi:cytochrome c5